MCGIICEYIITVSMAFTLLLRGVFSLSRALLFREHGEMQNFWPRLESLANTHFVFMLENFLFDESLSDVFSNGHSPLGFMSL